MITRKNSLILYLILFSLGFLIYYTSHIQPAVETTYIVFTIFIGLLLFSYKFATYFFIALLIFSDEFSRSYLEPLDSGVGVVSIFTAKGVVGSVFFDMSIILFGVFILLEWSKLTTFKLKTRKEILFIIYALLVGGVWGGVNLLSEPRIYISDFTYFFTIVMGYLIVRKVTNDELCQVKSFFHFFLALLVMKLIIVILDYIFFATSSGLITIKAGSDAYLICILPLLVFVYSALSHKKEVSLNLFFIFIVFLVALYLIVTASRGRVLVFLLSMISVMYLNRSYKLILYFPIVGGLLFLLVGQLKADFLGYFIWKMNTFLANSEGGSSSLVRLYSFYNILYEQIHSIYGVFIGQGFGGYFSSAHYPFPITLDEYAFPLEWIESDRFYKPHTTVLFLFLKIGLVPTLLVYSYLSMKVFYKRNYSSLPLWRISAIGIYMMLPFLMLVNFTSKLQFFTGIFLGLYYGIQQRLENEKK